MCRVRYKKGLHPSFRVRTDFVAAFEILDDCCGEDRTLTRQRRWQLKQQAAGRCPKCGKDAGGKFLCGDCAMKKAERWAKKMKGQRNE